MSQRITVQDGGVFYAIPEGPGLVQPQPGSDLTGITFGIDGQINVVQANVGPPSTPGYITTPAGSTSNLIITTGVAIGPVVDFGLLAGGSLYTAGVYSGVSLTGGHGSGATANITVSAVGAVLTLGTITPGFGYIDGVYTNVALTGGSGTLVRATVTVVSAIVAKVVITTPGINYLVSDILSAMPSSIGGLGGGFSVPVTSVGNANVTSVVLLSGGTGYDVGDVLSANSASIGGTGAGFSITISKVAGGNLVLNPYGSILLNGVAWPTNPPSVTPGYYLGSSSLNTLDFYPFIIALNGNDNLTTAQLNSLYPDAQPGQFVAGATIVYQCVGTNVWYKLGGGGGGGAVSSFQTSLSGLFPTSASTGAINLTGVLGIGSGGTGQTTKDTAFDALAPSSSTGDMIFYNGTHNVALPIGTSGQVLTVAGGMPQWNTSSVTLASNLAGGAANEIPFQSAVNTTTFSPRFTWQDGLAILGLGSTTGHVYITATEVGGTLTIGTSDSIVNIEMTDSSGITFTTGGTEFIIGPSGDWTLNATPGIAGQVLTSQGGGLSPIWQIPHGSNVSAYFDYLSVYPQAVVTIPSGTLVIGVEIIILNPPFLSGVTFTVGSLPSYSDLASSGDSDPQVSGTYTVGAGQFYLSSTNIYIQSTGTPPASQGSGYVVILTA